MSDYFSNLDPKIKEYFSVLSEDIPDWLVE